MSSERERGRTPHQAAPAAARPPSDDTLDVLPRRFGRYQLFARIGKGGMATIYLARMESGLGADRLVVVKQIHETLSRDPAFATQFVDEAKLCAGLRHANIAQVVDLGRGESETGAPLLFMAMEYVEGFDLQQLLRKLAQTKIPLPPEFAFHIVHETLAGLDFAHRAARPGGESLGIVHRDVSPSNVLLSFEGEVKLCDFGIAKAFGRAGEMGLGDDADGETDSQHEGSGRVVGKSAYMSPEQARGDALDGRSDVFAAGILLWEMCAGRRLYKGSEAEMLELARRVEIPRLPNRGLPGHDELQGLLDTALAADRDARFPTAKAMLDALEGYLARHRLFTSQLRFAAFLTDHFSAEVVADRRAKEVAARALALGPPAEIVPLAQPAPSAAPETAELRASTPRKATPKRRPAADVDHAVAEEMTVLKAPARPAPAATQPARVPQPEPVNTAYLGIAAMVLMVVAAALGAGLFWLLVH